MFCPYLAHSNLIDESREFGRRQVECQRESHLEAGIRLRRSGAKRAPVVAGCCGDHSFGGSACALCASGDGFMAGVGLSTMNAP